jgi:hypothetical protein
MSLNDYFQFTTLRIRKMTPDLGFAKSASWALALSFFAILPASAKGAKKPDTAQAFVQYEKESLNRFASMVGVSPNGIRGFQDKVRQSSGVGSVGRSELKNCVQKIDNNLESRNSFLGCLQDIGRSSLNEELMFQIEEKITDLLPRQGNSQIQKTLFLLSYVSDLIRENRIAQKRHAHWFDMDHGFVAGTHHSQYSFEHGDIGLAMGNTSISAMISQVTAPQAKFSHAFWVKELDDGSLRTIESEVQSGVREYESFNHYSDYPYNEVWVTRWNGKNKNKILADAVSWASNKAEEKTPYDFSMDMSEDKKIFCSELVVSALTHATGMSVNDLIPTISKVKTAPIFNYIGRLGIRNQNIPSPADLAGSSKLDVMVKYRNADSLIREWELYMMGDVMVDRLNRGAKFHEAPEFAVIPLPVYLLQLFPSLLSSELRLIPKQIDPEKIAVMATTEIKLFRPAIKYFRSGAGEDPSLLQVSPWYLRAALDYWVDNSSAGRRHLPRN